KLISGRTECDGGDLVGPQGLTHLHGVQVPELRPVFAAGGQGLAVRGESDGAYPFVPQHASLSLAGREVPEADGVVAAGDGQELAVGGPGQRRFFRARFAECPFPLRSGHVPELDFTAFDPHDFMAEPVPFTGAGEELAVRRERQRGDRAALAGQCGFSLGGVRLPEDDLALTGTGQHRAVRREGQGAAGLTLREERAQLSADRVPEPYGSF